MFHVHSVAYSICHGCKREVQTRKGDIGFSVLYKTKTLSDFTETELLDFQSKTKTLHFPENETLDFGSETRP